MSTKPKQPEFRLIRLQEQNNGVIMRQVFRNEHGQIDKYSSDDLRVADHTEQLLGERLVCYNQAMLEPVLEFKEVGEQSILEEAREQPKRWELPQSDHWKKAVIYRSNSQGKVIDHRRDCDELYWIKIRDYTRPIAAFKAIDDVDYAFFYVARGDGLIVATYGDEQIENEAKVNLPF